MIELADYIHYVLLKDRERKQSKTFICRHCWEIAHFIRVMLCPFYFIQLPTLKCTIANEMQIFDRNNKGSCLKRKRPSPGACSGASVLCLMYKIISTARIPAPCSWKQIILLREHFLYIMDRSDITGVVIHLYLGWYQNSFSV